MGKFRLFFSFFPLEINIPLIFGFLAINLVQREEEGRVMAGLAPTNRFGQLTRSLIWGRRRNMVD